MKIHLGGHLKYYDTQKRSHIQMSIQEPVMLIEVCRLLGVPSGDVALAVVNGKIVEVIDAQLTNQDNVELFSALGGG